MKKLILIALITLIIVSPIIVYIVLYFNNERNKFNWNEKRTAEIRKTCNNKATKESEIDKKTASDFEINYVKDNYDRIYSLCLRENGLK
jgi:flagellar basal body-associated protein FliL